MEQTEITPIKSTKKRKSKKEQLTVNTENETQNETQIIVADLLAELENTEQEIIPLPQKKKSFTIADYSKEYEWIPSDEIELDEPLRFIFTMANNIELAHYNDNLMKLEGNSIVTYQNWVDIELLNRKLVRIENIEIDGEIKTIYDKPTINLIIDKVLDLDTINELSGFIRVISNCKGKLY